MMINCVDLVEIGCRLLRFFYSLISICTITDDYVVKRVSDIQICLALSLKNRFHCYLLFNNRFTIR